VTDHSGPMPAWGHVQRLISVHRPAPAGGPEQVADRLAIAETISCYGWGFDERRADLLGDLFTADGVWTGSIAGSTELESHRGRDAIVSFLSEFWMGLHDQRRHNFVNVLVTEQDETRATALAYLLLTAGSGTDITIVTSGFYRLSLAKEDRTWRMSELYAGFDVPF